MTKTKSTPEIRAEDVCCPDCQAAYGEACTYQWEGQTRKRFEPHYERLVRAREKARAQLHRRHVSGKA